LRAKRSNPSIGIHTVSSNPGRRLNAGHNSQRRGGARCASLHLGYVAGRRTARAFKSFSHHDKLFPETGPKTSRSSGQRRRKPTGPSTSAVVFIPGG
jgi:hypothetical protein